MKGEYSVRVMKYLSKSASANTLKRFFVNNPDKDSVTLEEIFIAADRDLNQPEKNLSWLSNKMTHLRYHNLVTPDYYFDGRRKLKGLRLTIEGKRAIGRIDDDLSSMPQYVDVPRTEKTSIAGVSLNDVARVVKNFRDNNPEFLVVFDVKLREANRH